MSENFLNFPPIEASYVIFKIPLLFLCFFVYRPLLHSGIDLVIVVHKHFLQPISWKR